MGREVRITIDDDEVFERMKRRKRELDLSWEDVLHRGLRRTPERSPTDSGYQPAGPGAESDAGRHSSRTWSSGTHHDPGHADPWDRFADSIEAQVQSKVYNALRDTFGAAGIDMPSPPTEWGFDPEMAHLSNAEDAVLGFEFLPDEPTYQIPLRVNLEASADGLAVEVVTVREGKSVRDMNHFDPQARRAVTTSLAEGQPAVLRFDDGAEAYPVEPALSWGRDEAGRPAVTGVRIEAVRLGEADDE